MQSTSRDMQFFWGREERSSVHVSFRVSRSPRDFAFLWPLHSPNPRQQIGSTELSNHSRYCSRNHCPVESEQDNAQRKRNNTGDLLRCRQRVGRRLGGLAAFDHFGRRSVEFHCNWFVCMGFRTGKQALRGCLLGSEKMWSDVRLGSAGLGSTPGPRGESGDYIQNEPLNTI